MNVRRNFLLLFTAKKIDISVEANLINSQSSVAANQVMSELKVTKKKAAPVVPTAKVFATIRLRGDAAW